MDFKITGKILKPSQEGGSKTYKQFLDPKGKKWLVGTGKFSADHIYRESDPGFLGFGGRKLSFTLEDGTTTQLVGPWKTDSHALLRAVGIDLKDKYRTFVVVSESKIVDHKNWYATMINVLHVDSEPKESEIDRGIKVAQAIANKLGKPVHYYTESEELVSFGSALPKGSP